LTSHYLKEHLAPDQLSIERTFAHSLSGKAKSETKHKGVGFHTQVSPCAWWNLSPDSNIRVDIVPISPAEYSKWFRHRWDESVTWITEAVE
jgi:hypothetical protein